MWIKHYSNARQSEFLSKLYAKYGWEGYGKYWGLLELLATSYDGNEPIFHVPRETVRALFGVRSWNDLQSFVDWLTNERVLKFALCENVYRIEAPILLDLLNRDFKRARKERVESAPREDKSKNKKKDKEKEGDTATALPRLALLWNSFSGKLPKVVASNSKRKKSADQRLKEYGDEKWIAAIVRVAESDFCNGLNDRSWVATFDWILKPDSYLKITEGKYDNRKSLSQKDIHNIKKTQELVEWANDDKKGGVLEF